MGIQRALWPVIFGAVVAISPAAPAAGTAPALFEERAGESGLDFIHFNGMCGGFYMSEMMGAGAALLDYDNDGDLDVYLVQGAMLEADVPPSKATFPPPDGETPTDRLFRNDTVADDVGNRVIRFTDVTKQAALDLRGYGMGVATGDYDNDGWVDLYVTKLGSNALLRNNGDGTFSDRTAAAGVDDTRWSVSASFFDADRDGWLDLYVTNYVDFSLAGDKTCRDGSGAQDYCGPTVYGPYPDRLFRNNGDGSYSDITESAGIAGVKGAGLGVVAADVDNDGWLDLYVANDRNENRLWINQKNGRFRDNALLAGCAVNLDGRTESSMGVAAGDFDEDGDEDLFTTHLGGETNTLYINDGRGNFTDATIRTGLGAPSLRFTAFGTDFRDLDNDGWLDLLVVNGAMIRKPELVRAGDPYPLHEPNQFFRNLGNGRFEDLTAKGGPALALSEVSHGAAFGDIDNDGDVDVVVTNNNGPVRLLINNGGGDRPWVGLRLIDPRYKRDALGARLLVIQGDTTRHRRVATDGSYASAGDPRLVVGLDGEKEPVVVVVNWPDGRVERFSAIDIGRYNELRRGDGRVENIELETVSAPVASGQADTVIDHIREQTDRLSAAGADDEISSVELASISGETGRVFQTYGFLDEAAPCYRNALLLDGTNDRWAYLLGILELTRGRSADALDAFNAILARGRGNSVVFTRKAEALLQLGRFDEAAAAAVSALEMDPDFVPAHSVAGQAAVARGDPAAAVARFLAALELQPEATKLVYPLVASLNSVDQREEAMVWAERRGEGSVVFPDPEIAALEDLNRSSSHQTDRCLEALDVGRAERAIAYCRRAVVLDGDNLEARINLGVAFSRFGSIDRAIAEYREVLRTLPSNPTARFNLAVSLASRGNDEAALFHLDMLIRDHPDHPEGRFNRANVLRRLGRCEEAVESYRVAVDLMTERAPAMVGEAMCLTRLGFWSNARTRLEEGHAISPNDMLLTNSLARILATAADDDVRDGNRAVVLAESVVASDRDAESLETLAMGLAEAGDFETAVTIQREALDLAVERGDVAAAAAYDERLSAYLDGIPCRKPWR